MKNVRQHEIVMTLIEWLEKNKSETVPIERIAERSGFSKWYIQRFFKQQTSFSVASYNRQRRLTTAALLLRATDLSVIDIAHSAGFTSHPSFTKAFKRLFGMSPKKFRDIDNWSFKNLVPRIDYLARISEFEWSYKKLKTGMPIMGTPNVEFLELAVEKEQESLVLLQVLKKASPYNDNYNGDVSTIEIPFSYILCGQEVQEDASEQDWLSIKMRYEFKNLYELQKLVYQGVLPLCSVTRRKGPDCLRLEKTDGGLLYITEYLVPCIMQWRNNI